MSVNVGSLHRLRDSNLFPCIVGVTKNEILWRTLSELRVSTVIKQISFKNIIGTTSLSDVTGVRWLTDLSGSLQKKKACNSRGFTIWSTTQAKKYSWKVRCSTFYCVCDQQVSDWVEFLNSSVLKTNPSRPRNLLVFINPFSGLKKAQQIYTHQVAPLFYLANIQTKVVATTSRDHATDYLIENSLDSYDGVICVGGDGFLAEAVQGLLLHERRKFNLPLFSGHKPGEIELKPTIRLGVIPAGSTDAVSYSVHGTNDVVTAALHIISGDDISLDVVTVHADDDGTFIRYVLTMLGYGFHSDLLRNDDKRRWMGPQRYNYSGLKTLLQHASYHGEISFLPCSDPNNLSSNGIVCNSGCSVCESNNYHQTDDSLPVDYSPNKCSIKHYETEFDVPLNSSMNIRGSSDFSSIPSSLNNSSTQSVTDSQALINQKSLDSDVGLSISSNIDDRKIFNSHLPDLIFDKNSERNSFDVNSCNIMSNKREKISNIGIEQLHDNQLAPSRSSLKPIRNWHTIRGTFLAINAFVQSCRCSRAVCGPAPWAHLGDGCLDLVLVHKCSKVQFIRYLMSIAQNRHMTPEENPFNFPFISVMKVCAFRFVAQNQSNLKKFAKLDTNCLCNKQHNLQIIHNVSINDDSTIESLSTTSLSEPNSSNPTVSQKKKTIWCSDGELIQKSSIICFVHRKLIRFFGRGPEQHSDSNGSLDTSVEKQESCRLISQSMMDEIYSIY
ncbi:unnamed protein product [Schistosoma rodhaini]|uniref:DAGKc domain-containing protein n=1 Tax=Schistosoma rodhaini TaxID=6188 RepID=A0AA85FG56_9TREM|nr:unnamed protein product [Schistosoma rodhaini]